MNKELYESKTMTNLVRAFAGESQASARYKILADEAKKQGLCQLSEFMKMVSTNEYYHAKTIYGFIESACDKPIDGMKVCANYPFKEKSNTFVENFRLAAFDENEEATEIYPSFARIAHDEGFKEIGTFFDNLVQVETCHNKALTEIYNELKNDTMYNRTPAIKWKCAHCGHEATLEHAWKKCPICNSPQGDIMLELEEN